MASKLHIAAKLKSVGTKWGPPCISVRMWNDRMKVRSGRTWRDGFSYELEDLRPRLEAVGLQDFKPTCCSGSFLLCDSRAIVSLRYD